MSSTHLQTRILLQATLAASFAGFARQRIGNTLSLNNHQIILTSSDFRSRKGICK